MNFLGVGPLELLILAVIALLVLGPKGLTDLGRKTGRFIRQITRSPFWQDIVNASRDINDLPGKLMREADLEDDLMNIQKTTAPPEDDAKPTTGKAGKA